MGTEKGDSWAKGGAAWGALQGKAGCSGVGGRERSARRAATWRRAPLCSLQGRLFPAQSALQGLKTRIFALDLRSHVQKGRHRVPPAP